jgi:hypothetical protein
MTEMPTRKRNETNTSAVNGYQVFPRIVFDSHFMYSSGVSISLKLSSGYRPGLSRGRFRTDGRSDDGRGGVRDLDAL